MTDEITLIELDVVTTFLRERADEIDVYDPVTDHIANTLRSAADELEQMFSGQMRLETE